MTQKIVPSSPDAPSEATPPVPLPLLLCYLLLALAFGTALTLTAPPLSVAPLGLAGCLAALAVALRWLSRRDRGKPARPVTMACYVAAVLLLPAPWPLLVVLLAEAVHALARSGASVGTRVALPVHAVVVAALFTLLADVVLGHGHVVRMALALPPDQWRHAASAHAAISVRVATTAPGAATLLGLAISYYLLDTASLLVLAVVARRMSPARIWVALYRPSMAGDLAAPALGVLAAALYTVAPPLLLLVVPALAGLAWSPPLLSEQRRGFEPQASSSMDGQARDVSEADTQARLGALLAAVRAMAAGGDLAAVTAALAEAAARLTAFRGCVVYLYDARDGSFVPGAGNDEAAMVHHQEPIPREAAEQLMSHRNLLGYSYYAPFERLRGGVTRAQWRTGDVLLVPLLLKNGDVLGFISLDRPADGAVPTAEDLVPVETVAALAAGVIARLRHADEALRLAATDGLTGLLNRRALEERLHGEIATSAYRRPVALMMIDLDDFGGINNVHGHLIGDEALRTVAAVIRAHLRQDDAAGRYGGDEFVVILPGFDSIGALDVAERVRAALVEATASAAAGGRLPLVHTSIGVASYPDDAASAETLIKAADDALYNSKRLGKNKVSLRPVA